MAAVAEICDEWADSVSSRAHPSASSLAGAIVAVQPVSQMSSNSVMASRPPREIYRNPSDEASQPTPKAPRAELRVGMHVEVTANPAFSVGDKVIVSGLSSRPELTGAQGTVLSFDGERYAVCLDGSKEGVRIKSLNLRSSIFGALL